MTPFFVHFRLPGAARRIADRIPAGLRLEAEGDDALVSLVALRTAGPVPGALAATPLSRLFAYDQLNLRTYVAGPHGPGLFFLDMRTSRLFPLAARLLGLPYRRDARLAFTADASAVALRAKGVAVKGLPAPGESQPIGGDVERRLLEREWVYGHLPVGGLLAIRGVHPAWRVRRVEVDLSELRHGLDDIGMGAATLVSAQLADTVTLGVEEVKVYRSAPPREAAGAPTAT